MMVGVMILMIVVKKYMIKMPNQSLITRNGKKTSICTVMKKKNLYSLLKKRWLLLILLRL
ncbi:hypothetical protein MKW92_031779, partial [Papaver armeniacum]